MRSDCAWRAVLLGVCLLLLQSGCRQCGHGCGACGDSFANPHPLFSDSLADRWHYEQGHCRSCGTQAGEPTCCPTSGQSAHADDRTVRRTAKTSARAALKKFDRESRRPLSDDFEDGFEQAFIDVSHGCCATVAPALPGKYAKECYRTPSGQIPMQEWLEGYRVGVEIARFQGLGSFAEVATPERFAAACNPCGAASQHATTESIAGTAAPVFNSPASAVAVPAAAVPNVAVQPVARPPTAVQNAALPPIPPAAIQPNTTAAPPHLVPVGNTESTPLQAPPTLRRGQVIGWKILEPQPNEPQSP